MKFSEYFEPISFEKGSGNISESLFTPEDSGDLEGCKLAIIAIPEYRYSQSHVESDYSSICSALASLNCHYYDPRIALLGSLRLGNTIEDTESAVSSIISELIHHRVIPLIIGGDRELTYAVYSAFKVEEQIVNIASLDWKLNIEDNGRQGYIGRIVNEQPNFLFNYSALGYQTYHVSSDEIELAEDLYFDVMRLGELRGDIYKTEPIIRSSEILSISMSSLKHGDYRSALEPQPNGLYAEEVCQAMRYAGLGEKLKAVLLTDAKTQVNEADALLIAEMIWCLLDGLKARHSELPNARNEQFLKYRVAIKDDEFQLVFYKSLKTDRWWMEVPVPPQYANKYRKHHLIPCDYDDYKIATNDDLPNRWWKAYKKLL